MVVTRDQKHRLKTYRLTPGQFVDMLILQDHRCAICQKSFREMPKRSLCVDHDHSNGRIRDCLCDSCNRGLGYFYDDPKSLHRAAEYLQHHQSTLA